MRYIKFMMIMPLLLISGLCLAKDQLSSLNTVKLQLNDEAWVSTKTAKLVIAIDATLNNSHLANIQSQLLANLKKIAQTEDWHITQFNRTRDQSKLERLQVLAEARIPEAELASVSKRVEAVSKPGAAYRIIAIEFTPSMAEIEKVRTELRSKIYKQVKIELTDLNTIYPDAHYFVHDIHFREDIAPAINRNKMLLFAAQNLPAHGGTNEASSMQVSNQLQLAADVTLASTSSDTAKAAQGT